MVNTEILEHGTNVSSCFFLSFPHVHIGAFKAWSSRGNIFITNLINGIVISWVSLGF